jgi:hypothetical protein
VDVAVIGGWSGSPLTPEDRYHVRDPRARRFCLPRATTYPLPDGPDDPYGDRCAVVSAFDAEGEMTPSLA